jgi:hypothetical protein
VFCVIISLKRLIYLTLSGSLSFLAEHFIGLRIFSLIGFARHLHLSGIWLQCYNSSIRASHSADPSSNRGVEKHFLVALLSSYR